MIIEKVAAKKSLAAVLALALGFALPGGVFAAGFQASDAPAAPFSGAQVSAHAATTIAPVSKTWLTFSRDLGAPKQIERDESKPGAALAATPVSPADSVAPPATNSDSSLAAATPDVGGGGNARTIGGSANQRLDPSLIGNKAEKLAGDLRKLIVGQDDAINKIVEMYQTHRAGMTEQGRPIGNFLFLGPTGTGKTRLVEATAQSLVGDARAVLKIDSAEFQHSHEIAKLIGSPPGYLGHRETHAMLSQENLNQYHTDTVKISFVLFDEIEKASDALWNLLLGILDKGTLTLGDNRRVDFSKAMIFMTSNLGADEMARFTRPSTGFYDQSTQRTEDVVVKQGAAAIAAARRKFTPEFMNRIDKIAVFRPLRTPELTKILNLELNMLQLRTFDSESTAPFVFRLTDAAKTFLLQEGTDLKYGARHLKRAIERHLTHPLSNLIASDQVHGGDLIEVNLDNDGKRLVFDKQPEKMSENAMIQMGRTLLSAIPSSAPEPALPAVKSKRKRPII